jgi:hypothetical protein
MADANEPATQGLTIYLLKEEVTDAATAVLRRQAQLETALLCQFRVGYVQLFQMAASPPT